MLNGLVGLQRHSQGRSCGVVIERGVDGALHSGDCVVLRGLKTAKRLTNAGHYLECNRRGQLGLWASCLGPEQKWTVAHTNHEARDRPLRNGDTVSLVSSMGGVLGLQPGSHTLAVGHSIEAAVFRIQFLESEQLSQESLWRGEVGAAQRKQASRMLRSSSVVLGDPAQAQIDVDTSYAPPGGARWELTAPVVDRCSVTMDSATKDHHRYQTSSIGGCFSPGGGHTARTDLTAAVDRNKLRGSSFSIGGSKLAPNHYTTNSLASSHNQSSHSANQLRCAVDGNQLRKSHFSIGSRQSDPAAHYTTTTLGSKFNPERSGLRPGDTREQADQRAITENVKKSSVKLYGTGTGSLNGRVYDPFGLPQGDIGRSLAEKVLKSRFR
eukprot:TRINITY_DN4799_c0_g1_i3.p1 TRINITY_DN4799_c0_g1~~TRINITY_DN4799_c0_g1_i3.p1  ORF type:complete len:381 (-),score=45.05 TRINITY_DN4799_c0_g1_i3:307-1449(-)